VGGTALSKVPGEEIRFSALPRQVAGVLRCFDLRRHALSHAAFRGTLQPQGADEVQGSCWVSPARLEL